MATARETLRPKVCLTFSESITPSAHAALANGSIDLKDAYSTDAKIAENDLVVLHDDLHFFPEYKAVYLYRVTLDPRAVATLNQINRIDETQMTALNAAAEKSKNYASAAALFFHSSPNELGSRPGFPTELAGWIGRHLELAGISLLLSILIGLPLGIAASRGGAVGHSILALVGVIQTIPSLALLALLVPVPFLGISATTAIVALFLYGLLPIVRNTATGLQDIPPGLRDSAIALGLEPFARLRKIYLPLASRTILAGIKTSAVINIGTATLAAPHRRRRLGRADPQRAKPQRSRDDPERRDSSARSSRSSSRDCSSCLIACLFPAGSGSPPIVRRTGLGQESRRSFREAISCPADKSWPARPAFAPDRARRSNTGLTAHARALS